MNLSSVGYKWHHTILLMLLCQLLSLLWQCREVINKVQSLKQQLSDTQTELAFLQQQYNLGEKRLVRASKLISALGDEAGRWGISADTLATRLQLLIGQTSHIALPASRHLLMASLTTS